MKRNKSGYLRSLILMALFCVLLAGNVYAATETVEKSCTPSIHTSSAQISSHPFSLVSLKATADGTNACSCIVKDYLTNGGTQKSAAANADAGTTQTAGWVNIAGEEHRIGGYLVVSGTGCTCQSCVR